MLNLGATLSLKRVQRWYAIFLPVTADTPVIQHGLLDNPLCVVDFPIKTSIDKGFSGQKSLITWG